MSPEKLHLLSCAHPGFLRCWTALAPEAVRLEAMLSLPLKSYLDLPQVPRESDPQLLGARERKAPKNSDPGNGRGLAWPSHWKRVPPHGVHPLLGLTTMAQWFPKDITKTKTHQTQFGQCTRIGIRATHRPCSFCASGQVIQGLPENHWLQMISSRTSHIAKGLW